jgi:hypothetical protein
MTVIAFDGKNLAADRRMVQGGGIVRSVTKIIRAPNGCLLAITGGLDIGLELRQWYLNGPLPDKFPPKAREDEATLIVIKPNGEIWTWASGPIGARIESEKAAFGSGRDFAEAAMYLGQSAIDAVMLACKFQSDCGNGIDVLELNGQATRP